MIRLVDIKKILLSFATMCTVGFTFSGCGSSDGDTASYLTGTLKDSMLQGIEYNCDGNIGLTNLQGEFNYLDNCVEINFSIGSVKLGTIATSDINKSGDMTLYPADLLGIDRNDTTNATLANMIQILQTLDEDNNPYNGIFINQETRDKLENISLDLTDSNLSVDDLNEIPSLFNKDIVNRDYAISHYEDTLRNDLNLTVRTVSPAPAVYSVSYDPINTDSKLVSISGSSGTKIFINGIDINQTIDNTNIAYVNLDTSGGDGEISNIIILKDILGQESDEFNAILIKDTVSPILEIEDISIDENIDKNISISATDSYPIHYSISGIDNTYFTINELTGLINFKNIPDYETKKNYTIDITATDLAGNYETKTMKVSINHINDEIPTIGETNVYVEEGSLDPININVVDLDIDENQTFTYTIVGGDDAQYFTANNNLFFNQSLFDQTPMDSNEDNIYNVNVKITDGINESNEISLSIQITPKNENAPIITSPLSIEIDENFTGLVYKTTYSDLDNIPQTFTFSIDGTDAHYFDIDSITGEIKLPVALDYDLKEDYVFNLSVNDGVHITTVPIVIKLTRVFVNSEPVISNLSVDNLRVAKDENVTFNYLVSDENEDQSLTCSFDFNGDGIIDDTVLNCTSGTISYLFTTSGDYTPIFKVSDGIVSVSNDNIDLKIEDGYGTITGNVGDYFTETDLSDVIIKLLYNNEEYKTLVVDENGYYSFDNILSGNYEIIFDYNGYIPVVGDAIIEDGVSSTYQKVQMVPDGIEKGELNCNIKDAVTGYSLSNTSVKIYDGFNSTSTLISTQNLTSSSFSLELDPGYYTVVVSKDGYIDTTYSVSIGSEKTTTKDLVISPIIGDGEIRVVLSWGLTPYDLDSHMTKVKDNLNIYHISYANKIVSEGSLDTDDLYSYGPETITLNNMDRSLNTQYHYYVYNYSRNSLTGLSNSSAKVDIYYGNQTYTVYVPSGEGYYWKVFDINDGQIEICHTGCIEYTSDYYRNKNNLDIFDNLPSK